MKKNSEKFWTDWRNRYDLKDKEIDIIFSRYYANESCSQLLREFYIKKITGSTFVEHFPPIYCDLLCNMCRMYLYAFRSNRSHYKKTKLLYNLSSAHCLSCGHQENLSCECLECTFRKSENQNWLEQSYACMDEINKESLIACKRKILSLHNYCINNFIDFNPKTRIKKLNRWSFIHLSNDCLKH